MLLQLDYKLFRTQIELVSLVSVLITKSTFSTLGNSKVSSVS